MELINQLLILLLISVVIFTIDVKQEYFPVPVVLVLIGIALSFISLFSGFTAEREVLYEIFIPGLLFVSAYQFSARAFKRNAWLIITLSTIGMVGTVFLLAAGIYWATALFYPLSWNLSLLLSAILVPTDPISVVSILKHSSGPNDLADILEGESMLNDGTSIVIFTIILGMVESGSSFSTLEFLASFGYVSLGGVGMGLVFGWILSHAIYITAHRDYQVMLSVLVAYGSFMLAEHFGFSGVLATVVTGISLSFTFLKENVREIEFRKALGGFWNVVNPILSSILFLFIGIQAAPYLDFGYWHLAFIIFALSVVARFIILGGSLFAVPKWRKKFSHFLSILILLSWSGIKGSMSVVLLLWTVDSPVKNLELFISLGFASILISFVLQSAGIYPLTKLLHRK
ncbi:cation:proton antiporter [Marinilactibacillus piezotolerans]|uniref:cation:proton antiporter n=1 Tax=Marinilactibacillus piezotolerans TaxID=258723 RepID=UPI0009AF38E1|nr:cation:proton antiporter [Marinilactibacillus piezotolerans]